MNLEITPRKQKGLFRFYINGFGWNEFVSDQVLEIQREIVDTFFILVLTENRFIMQENLNL